MLDRPKGRDFPCGRKAGRPDGRPTNITACGEFVTYYQCELKCSVRRACQLISEREPWRTSGLSAVTLRRRFVEAARLRGQGKLGQTGLSLDFNFALNQDDLELMMGRFRYPQLIEQIRKQEREF